jgi:hypothetical protein
VRRVMPAGVKKCPRCDHYIPNDDNPGAYPGALSRTDNKTEICSPCGQAESIEDYLTSVMPQSQWVKNQAKALLHFAADLVEMGRAERGE